MAERIKLHFITQKVAYLLSFFIIALGIGVYLSLFGSWNANAAVASFVASDSDTSVYGVNGSDISFTLQVSGNAPTGFVGYYFYLVTSTVQVTTSSASSLIHVAFSPNHVTMTSSTLPGNVIADSSSVPLSTTTPYVMWVFTSSTDVNARAVVSTTAFSLSFDIPVDTNAPFIEHMSVFSATESATATLYAFVSDDQTTDSALSNNMDGGSEYIWIYYGADVSVSAVTSSMSLVSGSSDLFSGIVPSSTVGSANNIFEYYIVARDASNNTRFFCANPSAMSTTACAVSPFTVTSVAAGSRTIVGTAKKLVDNTALSGATVFAAGYVVSAATTAGDGTYTISGLPNNSTVDVTATKQGYCEAKRFEFVGSTNLTGVDVLLNPGDCGFNGSAGSDATTKVLFSRPFDGANNVPFADSILVGLNQSMNGSTINDTDPTDSGSAVYLTTDDGTTKIAGTVIYCATSATTGCSEAGQDTNVILFNPTSNLTTSTFYTLVVTNGVTSNHGKSIEGNRPGGGHQISFFVNGGSITFGGGGGTFGGGGQFMPPYVRSAVPAPGAQAPSNTKIVLEFSDPLDATSITTANITLQTAAGSAVSLSSVSLDNETKKIVTLTPTSALTSGEYEVLVKGGVKSSTGVTMRQEFSTGGGSGEVAFRHSFSSSGVADATAPTVYGMIANNTTGVAVNSIFEFGFSEAMSPPVFNTSNITFKRGSTDVSFEAKYDPGKNSVFLAPLNVLSANTVYTITLTTGITDLAGVALAANKTFTYTTGSADTAKPDLVEARCDDYSCYLRFTESMNNKKQVDGTAQWNRSVLNHANFVVTSTSKLSDEAISGKTFSYDSSGNSMKIEGMALAVGETFQVTVSATVADISGNVINTTGNKHIWKGTVEDSKKTFGSFDQSGMFGPPKTDFGGTGASVGGFEFKPEGFGDFTGEQFAFGKADMAFPFNPMASQDVNVFQVRLNPGKQLQTGDVIELSFPNGTTVTNAALDTFSPFYDDMNEFGSGTITASAISADNTTKAVSVTLAASAATGANDTYTIDLKKITNPSIPKDFSSGGYKLAIKVKRSGQAIYSANSMPYFIMAGGSNTINVRVFANSTSSPDNVAGSVFLFGGGPFGSLDKNITLAAGVISAVDGTAATAVQYTSVNDGCYFFGTDTMVTLGANTYFGKGASAPTCVNSSNASTTVDIILTKASASSAATLNVALSGVNFGTADIDVFAGGPGQFVVKKLTNVGDASSSATTTAVRLPANGVWFVGVGPSMEQGAGSKSSKPKALAGVAPSPAEVIVSGIGGTPAIAAGRNIPPGAAFVDGTDTLTFTFATANKTVSGTVQDGSGNALQSVEVFLHQNGFGAPVFTTTNASGTFSLAMSQNGIYEIGAFKEGLPSVFQSIELRDNGSGGANVYFGGKLVTEANPLVIKMKKPSYYISGKVLDASNNAIQYAPIFASDTNGTTVFGQTGSDGGYTLFVDNGTWTVRAELPPDKSDTCGSFSKTVTVSGGNKTSQNVTPSTSTCYTLTGTISVDSTALQSVPVFIEEWDITNKRPVAAGVRRPASTNASGVYTAKVAGSKTYRLAIFDPTYGEIADTVAVATSDTTKNITLTSANVTVAFTGGTSDMSAFIELKNSTDKTKRVGKQVNGLNANATISVESGQTYNYFVDVHGMGTFTGSVVAGATATIDLSSSTLLTISGTVKDANGNALSGALVTLIDADTNAVETAVANSSGNYSVKVKADTYKITASLTGYISGTAAQSVTFSASTTGYNFANNEEQTALTVADKTITGTVNNSSGSGMSEGYVWGTNASTGVVVKAAIQADGTYSLPVVEGTWTVEAVGPLHTKTADPTSVSVSGSNVTGNTFSLSAASGSTRTPTSDSGTLSASTGGTMNDTENTGIKLSAGVGELESSSSNVTVNFEKSYTAPDSEKFDPLASASFEITATGNSSIKNLKGDADIEIDYSSLISELPSGVSESDLQLMYYSPERGDYVPVEGGFTIDTTNNLITGQVDHFTAFVVAYTPPAASSNSSNSSSGSSGSSKSIGVNPPVLPQAKSDAAPQTTVSETYILHTPAQITVGASTHTVTVTAATALQATVTIQSDPITVTVKKDESKDVDTNADGTADLRVTYLGLDANGKATLTFLNLSDAGELENAVTINAGAYETNSRTVTLALNATNAAMMAVSNRADFEGSEFVSYATTTSWTLTEGNGEKILYIKFRSSAGGEVQASDTIVLTGQGFDQTGEASCQLTPKKAYKHKSASGVWYITDLCTKRSFNSPQKFFSYFTAWNDITVVDASVLDAIPVDGLGFIPWGSLYAPKGGTLVKTIVSPHVYLLLSSKKHLVASEAVFTGLAYAWDWIEDVAESFLKKYDSGSVIDSVKTHPSGTLIKYDGKSDVYQVNDGVTGKIKQYIPTDAALKSLDYREDRVITIDAKETYPNGAPIATPDAAVTFTKNLQLGATGTDVTNLQTVLKTGGYLSAEPTGYFGSQTAAAVKAFQAAHGLSAVGSVGPQTRAALNAL